MRTRRLALGLTVAVLAVSCSSSTSVSAPPVAPGDQSIYLSEDFQVLALGILVAVALPTFLGARTRAQDKAAQSDLRNAMAAALTFYTDGDTFSGFSPATAVRIEPSIAWAGDAKATRPGTVYIDRADKRIVIMTSRSASGAVFCIADDLSTGSFGGSVSYGTRDAFGTTRATGCGAPTPWP